MDKHVVFPPRGSTIDIKKFKALLRDTRMRNRECSGRQCQLYENANVVAKVQYVLLERGQWRAMQLFNYGDGDGDPPPAQVVAKLRALRELSENEIRSIRSYTQPRPWTNEVDSLEIASKNELTPRFITAFTVRLQDTIHLAVIVQKRAEHVWADEIHDGRLALRIVRALSTLLDLIERVSVLHLQHVDLNPGNVCEENGETLLLDWDKTNIIPPVYHKHVPIETMQIVTKNICKMAMMQNLQTQLLWCKQVLHREPAAKAAYTSVMTKSNEQLRLVRQSILKFADMRHKVNMAILSKLNISHVGYCSIRHWYHSVTSPQRQRRCRSSDTPFKCSRIRSVAMVRGTGIPSVLGIRLPPPASAIHPINSTTRCAYATRACGRTAPVTALVPHAHAWGWMSCTISFAVEPSARLKKTSIDPAATSRSMIGSSSVATSSMDSYVSSITPCLWK